MDTIDVRYIGDAEHEACITLLLNGVAVKGFFDAFTFACSGDIKRVTLELMTCSCGVAGCAGIFEGTAIKRRRYTTEWRDIDCGFPKKFYNFDNASYDAAIEFTLWALRDIAATREAEGKVWEDYDYNSTYRFHSVREVERQLAHVKRWFQQ